MIEASENTHRHVLVSARQRQLSTVGVLRNDRKVNRARRPEEKDKTIRHNQHQRKVSNMRVRPIAPTRLATARSMPSNVQTYISGERERWPSRRARYCRALFSCNPLLLCVTREWSTVHHSGHFLTRTQQAVVRRRRTELLREARSSRVGTKAHRRTTRPHEPSGETSVEGRIGRKEQQNTIYSRVHTSVPDTRQVQARTYTTVFPYLHATPQDQPARGF